MLSIFQISPAEAFWVAALVPFCDRKGFPPEHRLWHRPCPAKSLRGQSQDHMCPLMFKGVETSTSRPTFHWLVKSVNSKFSWVNSRQMNMFFFGSCRIPGFSTSNWLTILPPNDKWNPHIDPGDYWGLTPENDPIDPPNPHNFHWLTIQW